MTDQRPATFQSLGAFLSHLESAGELVRISRPVSVDLEIAEIADRTMKLPGGGPALLFERPLLPNGREAEMPVAINIFGSWSRISAALGVEDLHEHAERIQELVKPAIPKGLWAKVQMLPKLAELRKVPPRSYRGKPPCQEVVLREGEFDLTRFPVLRTWPQDGGPFITLPMVITRDPATGIQNIGMYRMQVFGPTSTGMHWQRHKGGAAHYRAWKRSGETRMPVVVAIGGDPTTMYTPSAPLPPGIDEYLFGGFLRREPVYTCKALTTDLDIPAEAEIVLEGYVDPQEELAIEGPFGDHTGFYTLEEPYPVFHVTTVTMRKNAVYPATLVGRPPVEDVYLGGATERIFLPLARLTMPEIVDYHMPPEGVFHNLVFVAIRKEYPGHAYKVMNGLWGMGLMSLAKVIVVVDEGIDVRNVQEAWWYALGNIDPERDVRFARGPVDDLDHAAQNPSFGSKMGIDGTRKWPEEGFTRRWPDLIVMDEEVRGKVESYWEELGIRALSEVARPGWKRG
jgi:4-hydroxy-3-polyprenylbenzoate decarboxylase